eukprot:7237221-Prymnesium_polylepis.2
MVKGEGYRHTRQGRDERNEGRGYWMEVQLAHLLRLLHLGEELRAQLSTGQQRAKGLQIAAQASWPSFESQRSHRSLKDVVVDILEQVARKPSRRRMVCAWADRYICLVCRKLSSGVPTTAPRHHAAGVVR